MYIVAVTELIIKGKKLSSGAEIEAGKGFEKETLEELTEKGYLKKSEAKKIGGKPIKPKTDKEG